MANRSYQNKIISSPAKSVLERNPKHDHKSTIMPIKVYPFSYFSPAIIYMLSQKIISATCANR